MTTNQSNNREKIERLLEETHQAAELGDIETVVKTLREIVEIKPFQTKANAHLAWLLSQRGEYRSALLCYFRLTVCRPWIVQSYFRTFQCVWFLIRRLNDRLSNRISMFRALREAINSFLYSISYFAARLLEMIRKERPIISAWMSHHRRIAQSYKINKYEYYKNFEIRFAVNALGGNKPKTVLDMGSGRSGFPSFLAGSGQNTIAFDLDRNGLLIQNRLKQIHSSNFLEPISGDFLQLPFRPESIDAIALISAIEHIPENGDVQTLLKLSSFLKNGGDLIVTVPSGPIYNEQWTLNQIGHVYEETASHENAKGFLRVYDPKALRERLIHPSGMQLVRLTYMGETSPWGWLSFGRNYVDAWGTIHPSLFSSPLAMFFGKELSEGELANACWAVACIHLKKI